MTILTSQILCSHECRQLCKFSILFIGIIRLNCSTAQIFHSMDDRRGLSDVSITSIVQDSQHFLWVGTKHGLNRYDGSTFKAYLHDDLDSASIGSDNITALLNDSKGSLWVGTYEGGLCKYNSDKDNFQIFRNSSTSSSSLSSNAVQAIAEGPNGELWIGTEHGLNLFESNAMTFKRFFSESPNSSSNITSVYCDQSDQVFVGTNGSGLQIVDRKSGSINAIAGSMPGAPRVIVAITSLDENNLLVGTEGNGLLKFNRQTRVFSGYLKKNSPYLLSARTVRHISRYGNLVWVGTDGGGLIEIDVVRYEEDENYFGWHYDARNSIQGFSSNSITAIFKDHEENMWFGTTKNGLIVLDRSSRYFERIRSVTPDGKTWPVLSVFEDSKGTIWMGTDGNGVVAHDRTKGKRRWYNYDNSNGKIGNYINCVREDKSGNIWVGSFDNGLGLIHYSGDAVVSPLNSFSHDVRVFLDDDQLWIGSWGNGLNLWNEKSEVVRVHSDKQYGTPYSLDDNVVTIERGPGSTIFVGTFGGGLLLFDKIKHTFSDSLNNILRRSGVKTRSIISLHFDSAKKVLWIGTWDEGLLSMDEHLMVKTYDGENGLDEKTIFAIEQDDQGNLWVSTTGGIFRLKGPQYIVEDFAFSESFAGEKFHINASFKDTNGRIYFGAVTGAIVVDPAIVLDASPVQPVLTQFAVSDNVDDERRSMLASQKTVELGYGDDDVTFKFTAIKLPFSDSFQYAVKLENFDADWRNVGHLTTIDYFDLPPGTYRFRVKSKSKGSLVYGPELTAGQLIVLPPFWRTWWAYALYLCALGIAVWLYLTRRTQLHRLMQTVDLQKHVDARKEQRLKFVMEVSSEIKTPLAAIVNTIEKIVSTPHHSSFTTNRQFWSIENNVNRLRRLADELLEPGKTTRSEQAPLRLKQKNIVSLVDEIYSSFIEYADNLHITYNFVCDHKEILFSYDKAELEKVIYCMFSDAFQATPQGGRITVDLSIDDSLISICIGAWRPDVGKTADANLVHRLDDESARLYQSTSPVNKEIVEAHHGSIHILSSNCGAQFVIALRRERNITGSDSLNQEAVFVNPRSLQEQQRHGETATSLGTILIVQADEASMTALSSKLREGMMFSQVFACVDGESAIDIALEQLPSIVISDIDLPVMNGTGLCRSIKENPRLSHIPVILTTSRDHWFLELESYRAGADDLIMKPFNYALLISRIQNIISERKRLHKHFVAKSLVTPKEGIIQSPDEKFLVAVTEFIERNITNDLRVEQLAREVGMSHSLVYKKLKVLTGKNINEFIRDYRLDKAAQLLKQNIANVSDVCYMVGFSDRRYFSRSFREKFGMNPSEYRGSESLKSS